jgi:UDPglucose--hexose-1-phosphate uridylyltransferase
MSDSALQNTPHRRFNPLTREWILVSPHRTQRPWQGKVERVAPETNLQFDPSCYLCPGNERAGGARNLKYTSTFVFDNDYAALLPDIPQVSANADDLLVARSEAGICRVACFSPRHDLTIPLMTAGEIRQVVDVWSQQFQDLEKLSWIRHIQIFENRGALMGASNPHPHCQIWATASLPNVPVRELSAFEEYATTKKACLLCDYLRLELENKQRIVCQNDGFAAVVPYWAEWPFEILLLSKRHIAAMHELSPDERDFLSDILKQVAIRYDNLFQTAFPYSMGFHQRPSDGGAHPEWHFHAHYYPPLLRSATVRKFMVGFEMLATPQRDITPESAANLMANLPDVHYQLRNGTP